MLVRSLATGIKGIKRRPGLVGLLYGLNLALAFVLAATVYTAMVQVVEGTGFGLDLAQQFDLALWADIIEEAGPALQGLLGQLFWIIPLYVLWKTAASVGLIHALRGDQDRSFWQGVARYTGRALLVAMLFVLLTVGWGIATLVVALGSSAIWTGEVGIYWTNFVVVPLFFVFGVALLDLMHDYARIALVVDERPVMESTIRGIIWPFKHISAFLIYLAWWIPAVLLVVLPTLLDMNMVAATAAGIWGLFLVQQIVLVLRAGVTAAWLGSEVAFYETIMLKELPLIAEENAEEILATTEENIHEGQGGIAAV